MSRTEQMISIQKKLEFKIKVGRGIARVMRLVQNTLGDMPLRGDVPVEFGPRLRLLHSEKEHSAPSRSEAV